MTLQEKFWSDIIICNENEINRQMIMQNNPVVSIVCNTYNHENYIWEAIEGFISQKANFLFEVLIHDDASTDNTANIIREYEMKYPDLIFPVYQKENQYSKKNHPNAAFQFPRAKGKYIALCEGDDYWTDPMKLQNQFDFLEQNPDYVMCYHSYQIREGDVILKGKRPIKPRSYSGDELVSTPSGIATATKFFKNVFAFQENIDSLIVRDFLLNAYLGRFGSCKFLTSIGPSIKRIHIGGVWSARDVITQHIDYIKTKYLIVNYFREQNDHQGMILSLRALNEAIELKIRDIDPNYNVVKFSLFHIKIVYNSIRFELDLSGLKVAAKKWIKKRLKKGKKI
jgi:glycosyltransferase involved in cell wall biosynthesis